MNPSRQLYGRITLNGDVKSLGFATFQDLVLRAAHAYSQHKSRAEINIVIEVSEKQLSTSILSAEARLEQEFNQIFALPNSDEESQWPGITIGRVAACVSSATYRAYADLATEPDNRIGVSQFEIDQICAAYAEEFPDCAPHFPVWKS